jgi:predicted DNA-binding protein YlxM (UPF0122 family)
MIRISEIRKQCGVDRRDIYDTIRRLGIEIVKINNKIHITEIERDRVFTNLFFNGKIEFITFESKMNYD